MHILFTQHADDALQKQFTNLSLHFKSVESLMKTQSDTIKDLTDASLTLESRLKDTTTRLSHVLSAKNRLEEKNNSLLEELHQCKSEKEEIYGESERSKKYIKDHKRIIDEFKE